MFSRNGEHLSSVEVLNIANVEPLVRLDIFFYTAPFGGHTDEGAHVRPLLLVGYKVLCGQNLAASILTSFVCDCPRLGL